MSQFNPEQPFKLGPLPPKVDLEIPVILKACIAANKELAKVKMAERLIPNQTVLINSISLLESQASSAIENIVTTTDELFEYAKSNSPHMTLETKETLQYRQALYKGYQSLENRPLNISTICEICSTIRQVQTEVRKLPGTALINSSSGKKIYTPPEGEEHLRELLTNWQTYLHAKDGVDPLIKLAVQHEKLLKVTQEGDWVSWALYFLEAVYETSKWTTERICAIQDLMKESRDFIREKAPSIYTKELAELLFVQPYVRIANVIEMGFVERQTASKHLKMLCEIGFLEELKRGKDKLFINRRFLDLLKKK
jgi:Fic family protein